MPQAVATLRDHILAAPILIVDDSEINRLFLEKALRGRGFTTLITASSAEEALAKMELFQPDMVLLDVIMPGGIDGFECCAQIREKVKYRDLPVLIQTSLNEPELRFKAFQKGATDFVSKPVYPDELCARVMVHLENRHAMKALQHYKTRIEDELEHAKQLQRAILPSLDDLEDIERRSKLGLASYYEPSSEIGGDFWGIRTLFPNQTALWLVDFSGHGVAAALNAFRLQAYLKEFSALAARPGEYMSHLNDNLLNLLLRGQFATMFYGIIDTQNNKLLYACACAPHPLILCKATGKVETIDGSGSPLGTGLNLYATQSTAFSAGDVLVLYSDAFLETPNAQGDYMTERDLMNALEKHPNATPAALKEILLDSFNKHAGDEPHDDLTLVICTQTP